MLGTDSAGGRRARSASQVRPHLVRAAAAIAAALVAWGAFVAAGCTRHAMAPGSDEADDPPPSSEQQTQVLFDEKSPYGRVIVVDTERRRCLKFSMEGGDQSCMDRYVPGRIVHEYVRLLSVGLVFVPPSPRMLMVGLGGGSAVRMFLAEDPHLQMDVVEIDPVVVRAARQYFNIVPSPRLRVHVADGREFFSQNAGSWQIIVLDAFGNDFIPFHLTTKEFLQTVAKHVTEDGVVVTNLWTRNDRLFRAMVNTYAQVFPTLFVFEGERSGNAIVVATRRDFPKGCPQIQQLAGAYARRAALSFSLTKEAGRCEPLSEYDLDGVPVLLDGQKKKFEALGPF